MHVQGQQQHAYKHRAYMVLGCKASRLVLQGDDENVTVWHLAEHYPLYVINSRIHTESQNFTVD